MKLEIGELDITKEVPVRLSLVLDDGEVWVVASKGHEKQWLVGIRPDGRFIRAKLSLRIAGIVMGFEIDDLGKLAETSR